MSLSRTVSEINDDFGRKSQISPTRRVFNAPDEGFSLEFCKAVQLKNKTDAPTRVSKMRKYMHLFRHNTGIGQTDGRTDKQMELAKQYCVLYHASSCRVHHKLPFPRIVFFHLIHHRCLGCISQILYAAGFIQ